MQNNLPFIYGQIEYLENNLNLLKKKVSHMAKKTTVKAQSLYGSLAKSNISLGEFKKIRTTLSTSWEKKWK